MHMLNQIEEKEKYDPIKTKQAILFFVEAWRKVNLLLFTQPILKKKVQMIKLLIDFLKKTSFIIYHLFFRLIIKHYLVNKIM